MIINDVINSLYFTFNDEKIIIENINKYLSNYKFIDIKQLSYKVDCKNEYNRFEFVSLNNYTTFVFKNDIKTVERKHKLCRLKNINIFDEFELYPFLTLNINILC